MTVIRRIRNGGKLVGDKGWVAKRFYNVNRLTYFLSPGKTIGLIYCVYFRNSNFIDFYRRRVFH